MFVQKVVAILKDACNRVSVPILLITSTLVDLTNKLYIVRGKEKRCLRMMLLIITSVDPDNLKCHAVTLATFVRVDL